MKFPWFENPPPISPSATPALGVGLFSNTVLLLMVYALMNNMDQAENELLSLIRTHVLFWYSALAMGPALLYGLSAAAWTGWSWWRVPLATVAGCVLGWCGNVLLISFWAAASSWPVESSLAWSGPHTNSLFMNSIASLLGLLLLWATLFARHSGQSQARQVEVESAKTQ